LVLCWVYLKTGSVLYSMLVHLGYNALAVFASLATK
jgi:membrane protease YdiL (CAAX protease family)